jgi:hypothetical protein
MALADGAAIIDYEEEPADHDVGYRGGINWSIREISLNPVRLNDVNCKVTKGHPLYDLLIVALTTTQHERWITEAIETEILEAKAYGNGD